MLSVTVLTATYNRKDLLPRLRRSLERQTCTSFEWIVVDDGSTDGTRELLDAWAENEFPFATQFLSQRNQGKHVALNAAIARASGSHCFIVDSDDWLPTDSIATVQQWIVDSVSSDHIAAVAGLKSFADGQIVGGPPTVDQPFVDLSNRERGKAGLQGDKGAEVYRTDVLRRFPFPVFPAEKFAHEAIVWNRIADAGYSIRWHPVVIYICEYLDGGLTDQGAAKHVENFEGFSLYMSESISRMGGIARFRAVGAFAEVGRSGGRQWGPLARRVSVRRSYLFIAYFAKRSHTIGKRIRNRVKLSNG